MADANSLFLHGSVFIHHLQTAFAHKQWANGETFKLLAQADAAQHPDAHHMAVRILNHVYVVDQIFAHNVQAKSHSFTGVNTPETPTVAALASDVAALDAWYVAYVATLSDADLAQPIDFVFTDGKPFRMTRGQMLMHVLTHGSYHRGAAGRLLMDCGLTPPKDSITYYLSNIKPD